MRRMEHVGPGQRSGHRFLGAARFVERRTAGRDSLTGMTDTRGIVHPRSALAHFGLHRYPPPEALAPYGLEVAITTPAQLAQAVKDEHAAWAPIVKRVGFTPES